MHHNFWVWRGWSLLVALVGALAVGAAPVAVAAEAAAVRVAASAGAEDAPLFVGVDQGIFAKHGLDVKVDLFPNGVEAINSLAGGNADVGVFGTYPFLAAVSKGIPLILIGHNWGDALASNQSEYFSLVAAKSSGIKNGDLASLKGKRLGVVFGSGAHAYVKSLFKQARLSEADVKTVNVPAANQATALAKGDIDVMAAWEPFASKSVAEVPGAVRVMHGGAQSFYEAGCLVVPAKVRDARPDVLTNFLIAYAEAGQWIRSHRKEAAQITTRWVPGVPADVLSEALRYIPQDLRLSRNTVDSYRNLSIPLMMSDGRIKEAFDPAKVIDARFYLAAEKQAPQFFSDLKPIPDARRISP
jgi:ABC-type nitrate/sulfonate/bicarbonate transport system substrate-binding protein